jgi:hypothetical protein
MNTGIDMATNIPSSALAALLAQLPRYTPTPDELRAIEAILARLLAEAREAK